MTTTVPPTQTLPMPTAAESAIVIKIDDLVGRIKQRDSDHQRDQRTQAQSCSSELTRLRSEIQRAATTTLRRPIPPGGSPTDATRNIQIVRVRVRDGHPWRELVCGEIQLSYGGARIRPLTGSVQGSPRPGGGFSVDWRRVDDDSGHTFVHTDGGTPSDAVQLKYGGVMADRLTVWTRFDGDPESVPDRMLNLDVEVHVGDDGSGGGAGGGSGPPRTKMVWSRPLTETTYNATAKNHQFILSAPTPTPKQQAPPLSFQI